MWKVVSFASKEPSIYEKSASELRRQCEYFGYSHDIRTIDFKGADRKHIVLFKPTFLLTILEASSEPILWLDCDTGLIRPFRQACTSTSWDVGFAPDLSRSPALYLNRLVRGHTKVKRDNAAAGFAIALRPTSAAIHFVRVWKHLCDWRELAPGGDHIRMNWARKMVTIREQNIGKYLDGSVIFNQGKGATRTVRGLRFASIK